jgi:transcriptional regulator with PAS, ATPase and Fis domain
MGESGTGKEVISRIIHENSPYSQGTLYSLNVSCIPESLAESELFGTVRGAYTDAEMSPGIFESATGGSVFLDEIGELSQPLQPKLLRVLEEKTVRPVGGRQAKPVSFRLICATNRDLYQAADRGTFRYDLLFRIDVLRVEIPPLRERLDDIPLLARHWLTRYRKDISKTAIERLCGYAWPGNVRELHACLSRAANDSRGDVIHPDSIRF